jgi:hypothetical protein
MLGRPSALARAYAMRLVHLFGGPCYLV